MLSVVKGFFGWIFSRFINAFNWLFTVLALVIILAIASAILGTIFRPTLPSQMVLTLDLRGELTDQPRITPFAFGGTPPSVADTIFALQQAEDDDRVKGLFVRLGGAGLSYGHAQELRAAMKAFREKGKFIIVHAQNFLNTDLAGYYLAAAADEIWLQPSGSVAVSGIASYGMFLRGLFDKIGAVPEFTARHEYKNAANQFMETDFTAPHREANFRLLETFYTTASSEIAGDRGLQMPQLTAAFNSAPHDGAAAQAAKLVDKLGFDDDALDAAIERAGGEDNVERKTLAEYYGIEGSPYTYALGTAPQAGKVALVFGEGAIVDGASEPDPFSGETSMGGDTIAKAIRKATEDETVKAIVLRVTSPGGSATASDQILDALRKAQAANKPVVISMGPVAASGGYWVSMYADKIYAQPLTITGSIGVLAGKISFGGVYDWLGVNYSRLGVGGPLAGFFNTVEPFSAEQRVGLDKFVDDIYQDFIAKVAEGRKMDLGVVQELAKGRVWVGTDAKDRKLVDEFGGLRDALAKAAELGGLDPAKGFEVAVYPERGSPLEALSGFLGAAVDGLKVLSTAAAILNSEVAQAVTGAAQDDGQPKPQMAPLNIR